MALKRVLSWDDAVRYCQDAIKLYEGGAARRAKLDLEQVDSHLSYRYMLRIELHECEASFGSYGLAETLLMAHEHANSLHNLAEFAFRIFERTRMIHVITPAFGLLIAYINLAHVYSSAMATRASQDKGMQIPPRYKTLRQAAEVLHNITWDGPLLQDEPFITITTGGWVSYDPEHKFELLRYGEDEEGTTERLSQEQMRDRARRELHADMQNVVQQLIGEVMDFAIPPGMDLVPVDAREARDEAAKALLLGPWSRWTYPDNDDDRKMREELLHCIKELNFRVEAALETNKQKVAPTIQDLLFLEAYFVDRRLDRCAEEAADQPVVVEVPWDEVAARPLGPLSTKYVPQASEQHGGSSTGAGRARRRAGGSGGGGQHGGGAGRAAQQGEGLEARYGKAKQVWQSLTPDQRTDVMRVPLDRVLDEAATLVGAVGSKDGPVASRRVLARLVAGMAAHPGVCPSLILCPSCPGACGVCGCISDHGGCDSHIVQCHSCNAHKSCHKCEEQVRGVYYMKDSNAYCIACCYGKLGGRLPVHTELGPGGWKRVEDACMEDASNCWSTRAGASTAAASAYLSAHDPAAYLAAAAARAATLGGLGSEVQVAEAGGLPGEEEGRGDDQELGTMSNWLRLGCSDTGQLARCGSGGSASGDGSGAPPRDAEAVLHGAWDRPLLELEGECDRDALLRALDAYVTASHSYKSLNGGDRAVLQGLHLRPAQWWMHELEKAAGGAVGGAEALQLRWVHGGLAPSGTLALHAIMRDLERAMEAHMVSPRSWGEMLLRTCTSGAADRIPMQDDLSKRVEAANNLIGKLITRHDLIHLELCHKVGRHLQEGQRQGFWEGIAAPNNMFDVEKVVLEIADRCSRNGEGNKGELACSWSLFHSLTTPLLDFCKAFDAVLMVLNNNNLATVPVRELDPDQHPDRHHDQWWIEVLSDIERSHKLIHVLLHVELYSYEELSQATMGMMAAMPKLMKSVIDRSRHTHKVLDQLRIQTQMLEGMVLAMQRFLRPYLRLCQLLSVAASPLPLLHDATAKVARQRLESQLHSQQQVTSDEAWWSLMKEEEATQRKKANQEKAVSKKEKKKRQQIAKKAAAGGGQGGSAAPQPPGTPQQQQQQQGGDDEGSAAAAASGNGHMPPPPPPPRKADSDEEEEEDEEASLLRLALAQGGKVPAAASRPPREAPREPSTTGSGSRGAEPPAPGAAPQQLRKEEPHGRRQQREQAAAPSTARDKQQQQQRAAPPPVSVAGAGTGRSGGAPPAGTSSPRRPLVLEVRRPCSGRGGAPVSSTAAVSSSAAEASSDGWGGASCSATVSSSVGSKGPAGSRQGSGSSSGLDRRGGGSNKFRRKYLPETIFQSFVRDRDMAASVEFAKSGWRAIPESEAVSLCAEWARMADEQRREAMQRLISAGAAEMAGGAPAAAAAAGGGSGSAAAAASRAPRTLPECIAQDRALSGVVEQCKRGWLALPEDEAAAKSKEWGSMSASSKLDFCKRLRALSTTATASAAAVPPPPPAASRPGGSASAAAELTVSAWANGGGDEGEGAGGSGRAHVSGRASGRGEAAVSSIPIGLRRRYIKGGVPGKQVFEEEGIVCVVSWDGAWRCSCGIEHPYSAPSCTHCDKEGPCRKHMTGPCNDSKCVRVHAYLDLPSKPSGSKKVVVHKQSLVFGALEEQQQQQPDAPDWGKPSSPQQQQQQAWPTLAAAEGDVMAAAGDQALGKRQQQEPAAAAAAAGTWAAKLRSAGPPAQDSSSHRAQLGAAHDDGEHGGGGDGGPSLEPPVSLPPLPQPAAAGSWAAVAAPSAAAEEQEQQGVSGGVDEGRPLVGPPAGPAAKWPNAAPFGAPGPPLPLELLPLPVAAAQQVAGGEDDLLGMLMGGDELAGAEGGLLPPAPYSQQQQQRQGALPALPFPMQAQPAYGMHLQQHAPVAAGGGYLGAAVAGGQQQQQEDDLLADLMLPLQEEVRRPAQQQQQQLRAGAGLANAQGEYHCFLNVIIQCLWHLPAFRSLVMDGSRAQRVPGPESDVLAALYRVFVALDESLRAAHTSSSTSTAPGGDQEAAAPSLADPTELRGALSRVSLPCFQSGEMGDAHEALEGILECLDAALRRPGDDTGSVTVPGSAEEPAPPLGGVRQLLGLPMTEAMDCGRCGKKTRMLRYCKFTQLVPADALRAAGGEGGLEAILAHLLDTYHADRACDPDEGGCGLVQRTALRLRRLPHLFTLALVWDSAAASDADIAAVTSLVATRLDLQRAYGGSTQLYSEHDYYRLRCMVCYYGSHYSVFVYVPRERTWKLYDDTAVRVVGEWAAVAQQCRAGRLQPLMLMYEGHGD